MRREKLPTTPGSVVWYDGHPWVLDGEHGVPTERRWVGIRHDGTPGTLSRQEMLAYGPAVVHVEPPE